MIKDNTLAVQKFVSGICCGPTTMAFLDEHNILVLEKWSGEVHLIHDGVLQETPVLKENVTGDDDQGMLGIDIVGKKVYLYFTEATYKGGPTICNCVYSYDWDGQNLVNRTLVKTLPHYAIYHIGGVMTTDLNGSVYLAVGENGRTEDGKAGVDENNSTGMPDDTGVVMRLVPPGPYYAIGVRNSFGLTVDPDSGKIWMTINGPDCCDTVDTVPPNFNAGWSVEVDPRNSTQVNAIPHYQNYSYHPPQFTWIKPVAPTGISFVDSKMLPNYKKSVFVGDCNNGNLYKFELNPARDGFVFNSTQLQHNIANLGDPMDEIIFGTGFGCITDIKEGPDGFVYILSYTDGAIYRLIPPQYIDPPIGNYLYVVFLVPAAGVVSFITYLRIAKKEVSI